ncbi:MAG: hypothetical protein F6K17_09045 [Okeania sp. SIO3C4]|nr:hypothetical protein [Okeania sp. SIO3C4]
MRKVKSLDIKQGNYEILLLGTSRVQNGLNPRSKVFGSKKAYNAGLASAGIYEVHQIIDFAQTRKNSRLKTVILGLDFFSFNKKINVSGDFKESRFANKNVFITSIPDLLSLQILQSSIDTLKFNYRGNKANYYDNLGTRNRELPNLNHRKLFRQILSQNMIYQSLYAGFELSDERLKYFNNLIEYCYKHNIELYLFISPVHAKQLETIRLMGLNPQFEDWKGDLVRIIAEQSRKNQDKLPINLWDFSGYNTITMETVPPLDSENQMKYFIESSHYKKIVGEKILVKILNLPKDDKDEYPQDFGVLINQDNIETHLTKIRNDSKIYQKNFPEEIVGIKQLIKETEEKRLSSLNRFNNQVENIEL